MYRLHFFLLLLLAAYNPRAQAQGSIRLITTNENTVRLVKSDPEYANRQSDLEGYIRSYKDDNTFAATAPTIPIVFHILYSSDEELIELDQVFKQIEALNRDFGTEENRQETRILDEHNYLQKQSFAGLQFCLPETDEAGLPTTGIVYYKTDKSEWSTDDAIKSKESGGCPPWDTQRFLNIWVGKMAHGIGGYAQMPAGEATTDGIVIDYQLFGNHSTEKQPYSEGKTLTHLVGNYLGLYSLWGTGVECSDDKVYDTPIHNSPNFGVPSQGHISLCAGYPGEMWMNFMDCTDDSLRTMFTRGQRERIYAVLDKNGIRSKLLETPVKCGVQAKFERSSESTSGGNIQVTAFPNPASDMVFVQTIGAGQADIRMDVFAHSGQRILFNDRVTQDAAFECASWPNGLYYLVFSKEGKTISTQKISILH